ncbi:hypothetical protein [Natrinema sp. DC36]|uniref:hypothetical protein n=1 Tax=Natrinema sp. DC36 TaxID=2878680 RepID=UPI001CEFB5F0|nr:hypothetical protein [Natrinema sp. DC36]
MGDVCVTCGNEYASLYQHYHTSFPSHKPQSWDECHSCGERYKSISKHWSKSECQHPPLTQRQYEIITGLVMGDGCVGREDGKSPRLHVRMITKEYLEFLDSEFEILGTGVSLYRTAEEGAKLNRKYDFRPNADSKNYHDCYYWGVSNTPHLNEFASWYDSGKKVWSEGIELTPTVLKHWYVGDGCYVDHDSNDYIKISLSNEVDSEEKVGGYFEDVGLPRPNRWGVGERRDGGVICDAVWNIEESYELLEYMLEDEYGIPPGFKYKWPEEFHEDNIIESSRTPVEATI